MTVIIEKPAINLREELADPRNQGTYRLEVFYFEGNGSSTTFALQKGWKPKFVYSAGLFRREGTLEDYTIVFDGFVYSVVFAVAPAVVNIDIICEGTF